MTAAELELEDNRDREEPCGRCVVCLGGPSDDLPDGLPSWCGREEPDDESDSRFWRV